MHSFASVIVWRSCIRFAFQRGFCRFRFHVHMNFVARFFIFRCVFHHVHLVNIRVCQTIVHRCVAHFTVTRARFIHACVVMHVVFVMWAVHLYVSKWCMVCIHAFYLRCGTMSSVIVVYNVRPHDHVAICSRFLVGLLNFRWIYSRQITAHALRCWR